MPPAPPARFSSKRGHRTASTTRPDQLGNRPGHPDPQRPDRARWATEPDVARATLTAALDTRRRTARHDPLAAIELGPRPTHPAHAALWDHAAARLDQHHAAFP